MTPHNCPICGKDLDNAREYKVTMRDQKIEFICITHKTDNLPVGMNVLYTYKPERQHFMKNGGYAPYNNSFAN